MSIKQTLLEKLLNQPKNLLVNGGFCMWQRNITFSSPSTNTYTADRWTHIYDGSIGTFAISRQAFALGQTDVPGSPKYYLRWAHTVAGSASTYRILEHRIENVTILENGKISVSFYAKADAERSVSVRFLQNFGTGGSPSSSVNSLSSTFSLTTSWAKYSTTLDIASISGKTLGTGLNDYLSLQFVLPINTTMTLEFAQVMCNSGGVENFREVENVIQRAQRFYTKTFAINTVPVQASATFAGSLGSQVNNDTAASDVRGFWKYPAEMRAVPTIVTYNPTQANANWRDVADSGDAAVLVAAALKGTSSAIIDTTGAPAAAGTAYQIHVTADAEIY